MLWRASPLRGQSTEKANPLKAHVTSHQIEGIMWEGRRDSQERRVVVNRVRPMWANQELGGKPPRPLPSDVAETPPQRPQAEIYDIFCKVSAYSLLSSTCQSLKVKKNSIIIAAGTGNVLWSLQTSRTRNKKDFHLVLKRRW